MQCDIKNINESPAKILTNKSGDADPRVGWRIEKYNNAVYPVSILNWDFNAVRNCFAFL